MNFENLQKLKNAQGIHQIQACNTTDFQPIVVQLCFGIINTKVLV
jgi:hypothetical protein